MSAQAMVVPERRLGEDRRASRHLTTVPPARGSRRPKDVVYAIAGSLRKRIVLEQMDQTAAAMIARREVELAERNLRLAQAAVDGAFAALREYKSALDAIEQAARATSRELESLEPTR